MEETHTGAQEECKEPSPPPEEEGLAENVMTSISHFPIPAHCWGGAGRENGK